jgi:hypothetical protein
MSKVASMLTDLATLVRMSSNRSDILDKIDRLHKDASNILMKDTFISMTPNEELAVISQWVKDFQEIVQFHNEYGKSS